MAETCLFDMPSPPTTGADEVCVCVGGGGRYVTRRTESLCIAQPSTCLPHFLIQNTLPHRIFNSVWLFFNNKTMARSKFQCQTIHSSHTNTGCREDASPICTQTKIPCHRKESRRLSRYLSRRARRDRLSGTEPPGGVCTSHVCSGERSVCRTYS